MKKAQVKLLFLLMMVIAVTLILVACDSIPGLGNGPADTTAPGGASIGEVYALYVENMNATSQTPLTYEMWLTMIRGEDGKDGADGQNGQNGRAVTMVVGFSGNDIESITIPNSVTIIGEGAFSNCESLKSITIPDSITVIGDYAFYGCTSLSSVVFGANSLCEALGEFSFAYCSVLTECTVPENAHVPSSAFIYTPLNPRIPQEELDKIHFNNLPSEIPYDGRPLTSVDVGVNKPSFLKASYTFWQLNPLDGSVIADLGTTYPTNVGAYKITATFSWQPGAEELYPGAPLPDPVSAAFRIVPADANRIGTFGVKESLTIFYYPGMQYDPATATGTEQFTTGKLPTGVTISGATIEKLASADATSGTAVAGGKITEAGIYKVTLNYAQEGNNYTEASLAGKSGIVNVIECPNQVLRKDNVAVDGVLDAAYLLSAHLEGRDQAYSVSQGNYSLLGDDIVDPLTEIALLEINKGGSVTVDGSQVNVDVYVLWGAMAGKDDDYVYVAVKVQDPTDNMRSEAYTMYANPWVNDGIRVYYNLGGYSVPVIPQRTNGTYEETYPTYNAVVNDSAARPWARPSAVTAQQSVYFADIEFASTRTEDGNGGVTYICEYAFPAKSESFSGALGPEFTRIPGEALEAGELLSFAFQFNDLTALDSIQNPLADETPDDLGYHYDNFFPNGLKYPNDWTVTLTPGTEWYMFEKAVEPYMSCYGNRSSWYLMHDQGGPSVFQLSSELAQ